MNLSKAKKIFANYLLNCEDKNKIREIINEMAKNDDELLESKIKQQVEVSKIISLNKKFIFNK